VATQGVINLLSAFLSHPPDRLVALRRLVPTAVIDTSRTFTLLSGLLLLVTALGLRNGKRRAFVMALLLCAVSVPVNLLKAIDLEEAIAASTLMFLLAISGDHFRVKSRELSLADIRWSGFLAAVGFAGYAVGGCYVLHHIVGGNASIAGAISEVAHTLTGLGSSSLPPLREMTHRNHRLTVWFLDSLHVTAATIIVGFALSALRPVAHQSRHRQERDRVAALIRQYGDSSVSEFALAPDSDYFFSANGRAVIAYRFESNALLAIGDPIGPEANYPDTVPAHFEGQLPAEYFGGGTGYTKAARHRVDHNSSRGRECKDDTRLLFHHLPRRSGGGNKEGAQVSADGVHVIIGT